MARFLADEDFNHRIIRGLRRRIDTIDLVTVGEVPSLSGSPDPVVLEYAANASRIVITHDENTMVNHANDRLAAGLVMSGLVVIRQRIAIGDAIDEIEMIAELSDEAEWNGRIYWVSPT